MDTPVNDAQDLEPNRSRYARLGDLVLEYKYWANPRSHTGLGDDEIKDLADSIMQESRQVDSDTYAGVRVPLEVVRIAGPNAEIVTLVIDGQRRYKACKLGLGKTFPDALLPVIDLEAEPVEWTKELADKYLVRALDGVGTRAALSSFELSESAERLRNSRDPSTGKEYTLAAIAHAVRRSESWVSKILAARRTATPKLIAMWRKGEITDEQFKDMAAARDPERQAAAAEKVAEARTVGDKGRARTLAKEQRLVASQQKAAAPATPSAGKASGKPSPTPAAAPAHKPVVSGPQIELPPARKPPNFAVIQDFLGLADERPPTHDYVRGVMDGARWATGLMEADKLAKPVKQYMAMVQGAPPKAKAPKAKPKAKAPKAKAPKANDRKEKIAASAAKLAKAKAKRR